MDLRNGFCATCVACVVAGGSAIAETNDMLIGLDSKITLVPKARQRRPGDRRGAGHGYFGSGQTRFAPAAADELPARPADKPADHARRQAGPGSEFGIYNQDGNVWKSAPR